MQKAKEEKPEAAQPSCRGWTARLLACACPAEVLEVAREYVAKMSYYEMLCLPEQCRPRPLLGAKDVYEYWFDLSSHAHGESRTAARVVQRLTRFFADADSRLTQLSVSQAGGRDHRVAIEAAPSPSYEAE